MLMVIYLLMAGIGLSIVQSHIKLIECKLNFTPQQCNESIFNSRLPIPAFFGIISSNQSDSLVNNDRRNICMEDNKCHQQKSIYTFEMQSQVRCPWHNSF